MIRFTKYHKFLIPFIFYSIKYKPQRLLEYRLLFFLLFFLLRVFRFVFFLFFFDPPLEKLLNAFNACFASGLDDTALNASLSGVPAAGNAIGNAAGNAAGNAVGNAVGNAAGNAAVNSAGNAAGTVTCVVADGVLTAAGGTTTPRVLGGLLKCSNSDFVNSGSAVNPLVNIPPFGADITRLVTHCLPSNV